MSRQESTVQSALEFLRWRGPLRSSALLLREALRPFLDWYVFHIVEDSVANNALPPKGPPTSEFTVRILALEDGVEQVIAALAEIGPFPNVKVVERLNAGGAVAIAYAGTRPVGCSWLTVQSGLPMPCGLAWSLKQGEAVLYGSYVHPDWRGKRVHPLLDRAMKTYLLERGFSHTLGSMSAMNPQTLSLARRDHKRLVMTLFLVNLRGVNWNIRFAHGAPLQSRFRILPDEPAARTPESSVSETITPDLRRQPPISRPTHWKPPRLRQLPQDSTITPPGNLSL